MRFFFFFALIKRHAKQALKYDLFISSLNQEHIDSNLDFYCFSTQDQAISSAQVSQWARVNPRNWICICILVVLAAMST